MARLRVADKRLDLGHCELSQRRLSKFARVETHQGRATHKPQPNHRTQRGVYSTRWIQEKQALYGRQRWSQVDGYTVGQQMWNRLRVKEVD
jgi:hypothetical protein